MGLGAMVLALGSMLGYASVANAATFNFSFSNVDGPVNGTVGGTIELPDGDGTFAATDLTITSAPAELGYTVPLDAFSIGALAANTFTVVGGMIDFAVSSFAVSSSVDAFTINFSSLGSLLNIQGSGSTTSGVQDSGNSTLVSSPATPASTPEPTSVITLIGVGVLGVASKKLKKKA